MLGGIATMGVVGLWSLVFPDLRDIDRFEDVMVDSGSPMTAPLIADRESLTVDHLEP